jgi:prepilin-type N-terminal cleavage/methylation domain-containing protein
MKSFTLIEILVSLAILSVIIGGIFSVFNIADKTWNLDTGFVELQQTIRPVMDGMVREIRQSNPSNVTLSSGGAMVTFKVPDVTSNISYYLSADEIIREHPIGTTAVLVDEVNSVCFCWDNTNNTCTTTCSDFFTVRLEATKNVRGRILPFTLSERVRLRNEN